MKKTALIIAVLILAINTATAYENFNENETVDFNNFANWTIDEYTEGVDNYRGVTDQIPYILALVLFIIAVIMVLKTLSAPLKKLLE